MTNACAWLRAKAAASRGGVLVQDTAWPGYEEVPLWIMQGYLTLACEADAQMPLRPTHVFLQAGVGSMAAAVAGYFALRYADAPAPDRRGRAHARGLLFSERPRRTRRGQRRSEPP